MSAPDGADAQERGLRIVYIAAAYLPWVGGIEILISQLIPLLRERGHEVVIVTAHGTESPSGFDEVDGVRVLRVPAYHAVARRDPAKILEIQRQLVEFVLDYQPDLVHAHDAGPVLWMYTRALRRRPQPVIVTLHNVMTHHAEGSLEVLSKLVTDADWVTGVSQAVVDDTLSIAPGVADHISLVRNGVQAPTREPTPVADGPPRLLCLGRLTHQKGFDRALLAVADLVERHPDLELVIAGTGPDADELADQARDLGISEHVRFLGLVAHEEISALLDACTLLFMPSRYEGLPLVALEAAWMARPVVGADAPGLSDAVTSETGVLVDGDDRAALADALDGLLTDRDRARALGAHAREVAEREWSLTACADAYEALYRRLL